MTRPLRWEDGALLLLDQTLLPHEERWLRCESPEQVADAIRRLAVRGAPAIGVAAAYALALHEGDSPLNKVARMLAATRPTAVNLRWALERVVAAHEAGRDALEEARAIHAEEIEAESRMAGLGASLVEADSRVLTHCNTGALATAGRGTAGAVIEAAHADGRVSLVWVDETRPLLQGARLTAWELGRAGVPYRLVTDSSVGLLMSRGEVDCVVVGADRIARNGDVANKIGTYTVAALADRHGVPFYVAAPLSTIDVQTPTGAEIPIEERDPSEVTTLRGVPLAPADAPAANFAFDVTPHDLVTAIVTEAGVLWPPFEDSIAHACRLP